MVNATTPSPKALPSLAPPVLPDYLKSTKTTTYTTAPQPVVAVSSPLPKSQTTFPVNSGSASAGSTNPAFRESPTIVKPNSQAKEVSSATKSSSPAKNTKPNNAKMFLVGAGLFIGILAISTGIWFISQSQDVRQQAYQGDQSSSLPTGADPSTFAAQSLPSPTPVLLALANTKACGQSCTSNNDCQVGNICSSADGYVCVLSACMEAAASCDATKCSLSSTPLGDGAGIGGTTSTLASSSSVVSSTVSGSKTATKSSIARTTQPSSSQALPVSGSAGTTLALIGSGLLFIMTGSWMFFRHQSNDV